MLGQGLVGRVDVRLVVIGFRYPGDEVGGAIVPEEEGDFLTQLARDVLDGAKLSDLQTLFADDLQVSHNPLGSLTTPSAVIVPGTKVMTWDDWLST